MKWTKIDQHCELSSTLRVRSSVLIRVPRLKLNTIVYQSRNNFKNCSFDIILETRRKLPPAKCHLANNTRALDVEKEQSLQIE